jgi:hypothetical protein
MPSITFWNRLEPRARSNDLSNALAARVRDPAWFLARQWQMGEFEGEDAASPAYMRVKERSRPMTDWWAPGQGANPVTPGIPAEKAMLSESFPLDDLATAVELGQTFERLLQDAGAPDLVPIYRQEFPVPDVPADAPGEDAVSARLRGLWKGRAIDGIALYLAAMQPSPPPPDPTTEFAVMAPTASITAPIPPSAPPPGVPWSVPQGQWSAAGSAVQSLMTWVQEVFGAFGTEDPAAWQPGRLEHALQVSQSDSVVLSAEPSRDGELDWHSFDLTGGVPVTPNKVTAVIPGHVRFRGMPNERFWDFEDGRVDIGAIRPDKRSLATMILMDFMLVHGNDWYLVPFEQTAGTICNTEIEVVNVFGERTTVPRADAVVPSGPNPPRWAMFTPSKSDGSPAPFFVLPDSGANSIVEGPTLEEVRFLRDDTANLVWAVERATENHLGAPRLGHERASSAGAGQGAPPSQDAALRYRLQTDVPANWIPFQPVALPLLPGDPTAAAGQIAFERASLLAADAPPGTLPALPQPAGKILNPRAVPTGTPYRVREEEIPREGTRVARVVRLSRGSDGKTHLWVSRTRSVGTGEGWSGLRYDLAVHEAKEP